MSVSASIFSLRILYLLTLLYQAVFNGTVLSFYGHPPEVCNVRKPERLYAEMTKEMWVQHLGDAITKEMRRARKDALLR